ncbi:ATP synthase complex subunit H-domain-containing protein [Trametes maxima]|nr:ATP synthase complex subunit H-domain-containing protein [Trametes maxima]
MSSAILRQASSVARAATRSCAFSTSAVARKGLTGALCSLRPARHDARYVDIVQDLYLQQLKTYKPPVQAKDAHVGVVKAYSLPPTPQAPTLPADLASELSAYDATEPTFAAAAKPAEEASSGPTGADAFLSFLEADEPKVEAHH